MARADMRELARAIELTDDTALRGRICFLLHLNPPRDSALVLPALLPLLKDSDSRLRGDAADAVLAIAHSEGHEAALAAAPDAGQAVFAALTRETGDFARAMLAGAVGQLDYEPAIPTLIDMLQLADAQVRRTAAWSLGDMRAAQAEPALRHALEAETDKYAAARMRDALAAIEA